MDYRAIIKNDGLVKLDPVQAFNQIRQLHKLLDRIIKEVPCACNKKRSAVDKLCAICDARITVGLWMSPIGQQQQKRTKQ